MNPLFLSTFALFRLNRWFGLMKNEEEGIIGGVANALGEDKEAKNGGCITRSEHSPQKEG
jgi:hypothetical protein